MRRVGLPLAFLVALLLAVALGQGATSGATVEVKSNNRYGSYLADSHGMALYTLSTDSKNASTCSGPCAKAWPPLTTQAAPTAGSGAAASLLGTIKRSDGSKQVSYNGLPLYTFVRDTKPGEVNGEGVHAFGGMWRLVSPYGGTIKPKAKAKAQSAGAGKAAAQAQPATVNAMELAQLKGEGEALFDGHCAVCHRVSGEGRQGKGPKLAGNSRLSDPNFVIHQILHGSTFMPAFATLTDKQVAAVATYIRTSWGNNFGPVTKEEVTNAR